jgi:membrane peptidoglycan carboxypeptidase
VSSSNDSYPEPEGWGKDGFWADSSIDADYETNLTGAVRPAPGPHEDLGYSYWSDGKGWENSAGVNAAGPPAPAPTRGVARAAYPGGPPADPTHMDYRGGPGAADATAYYGAGGPGDPSRGPGGPGRPGGPGGPGSGGPGPGGPGRNGKRRGSWWRHWSWKKALAVTGAAFGMFLLAVVGVYLYLSDSAMIPTAITDANYQNSVVYYSGGTTQIGTIGLYDRHDLNFDQIPVNLQNAVLAAEDRSFWTEGGISPQGILRAAYDDLKSSGGSYSGGSTITQQFVKNYYDGIGSQQTASRKVKEIFVAQKLAKTESKQWILQHYLNLIYLGDQSYGVYAAGETYFGEPVSKLTTAQDAVIASIIQSPSFYWQDNPADRAALIARWHYVLSGMVTMGKLTATQASSMKFPKLLTDSETNTGTQTAFSTSSKDPWAPYIMDVVYNELTGVDHIPTSQLETGGLKIVTTITRPMEAEMYKAVDEEFTNIKAQGDTIPSYVMTGAELQDPSNGDILAMYPGLGQNMSASKCQEYNCDLNTAIYTREQVGSSFKPYVLSAAVQEGMNVQTSMLNSSPQLYVPLDTPEYRYDLSTTDEAKALPEAFAVTNDDGEFIGKQVASGVYESGVQNALAQSSNTAFTDLAHRATTSSIIEMAQSYGVNIAASAAGGSNLSQMVGDVGLALGTASLTVNEQTTMLSTIDDDGVYHAAHLVKYWQQPSGPENKPTVVSHQVLTPQQDSEVQYAMEMTTVDGTGTAAAYGLGSRPIIAKTGTTTNSHSGFFIGAIPQYSLVVGMFTAKQSANSQSLIPLGGGGFGGARPAEIWNTFALAEFNNLPVESFQTPVFSGSKWNQIGNLPKKKKKAKKTNPCTSTGHAKHSRPTVCMTPTPTPTPTASTTATPTPTASASGTPTPTSTATPSPTASGSGTATPTPTATPIGFGGGGDRAASGVQAGLAVGGLLAVLPGSLLWTTAAARRRRKRRAGAGG